MSQINIEEMIRKYGEEEVSRLMNKIKNNEIMLKIYKKQISEMEEIVKEKRRQREKEQREKQKEEEENDR